MRDKFKVLIRYTPTVWQYDEFIVEGTLEEIRKSLDLKVANREIYAYKITREN